MHLPKLRTKQRGNQNNRKKQREKTGGAKRWAASYKNKQAKRPEMETEQEHQSNMNEEMTAGIEETTETNEQRKVQANQALWKNST